jgi:hypothetical protein
MRSQSGNDFPLDRVRGNGTTITVYSNYVLHKLSTAVSDPQSPYRDHGLSKKKKTFIMLVYL